MVRYGHYANASSIIEVDKFVFDGVSFRYRANDQTTSQER